MVNKQKEDRRDTRLSSLYKLWLWFKLLQWIHLIS